MAFTNAQFDVAGAEVSLGAASALSLTIRALHNPVWVGATGVTPSNGLLVLPCDGPVPIPKEAGVGTDELFAIALSSAPARVHILRRPIT